MQRRTEWEGNWAVQREFLCLKTEKGKKEEEEVRDSYNLRRTAKVETVKWARKISVNATSRRRVSIHQKGKDVYCEIPYLLLNLAVFSYFKALHFIKSCSTFWCKILLRDVKDPWLWMPQSPAWAPLGVALVQSLGRLHWCCWQWTPTQGSSEGKHWVWVVAFVASVVHFG